MYERFTDRARKAMNLAHAEARRHYHEYIGTEHALLGIVAEGTGVAANVLRNLNIELAMVRREVEKIITPGPPLQYADEPSGVIWRFFRWLGFSTTPTFPMDKLPQTPRVERAIEYAIEEARSLNHNYVGTEHLLLGLLREDEGVAAQILFNLGLSAARVRAEVVDLLSPKQ